MLFSKNNSVRTADRSIVEALHTSQAVIEFTPSGQVITANKNFLEVVGYRLEDIAGQHHSLFCDPAYVKSDEYGRFWSALAAGSFQSGEFKRFAHGGRVLWLQATYNPIRDRSGRVVRVVKFAADITASKIHALDSTGKVAAIDRSQAVIEFTPAGHVITANPNFLASLGYRLEEIFGQHHSLFCDPEYARSADYSAFWVALGRGEFQMAEYRRIGKGGREVYIQASYNPIFDDTGAVVKVVKMATDTTEMVRKRLRNDKLGHEINGELGSVISQMMVATEMATGASGASTETGGIVNSVAAASEELSQSVREIAHSMVQTRTEAESVFRHAETANASASGLSQSAASMNNVVALIQDIASQINLLALNATIESARAGEAGKGFAVVASEVKSLANQAASSTKTIAVEIANMQSVTTDVVGALGLISSSMNSVMENVASVAGAIEQQNAVTGEISLNMQSAVSAVQQIEDSLCHISSTFAKVSEASEQVKQNVEILVA
jgi:methyl-accepting chemotaxis protein